MGDNDRRGAQEQPSAATQEVSPTRAPAAPKGGTGMLAAGTAALGGGLIQRKLQRRAAERGTTPAASAPRKKSATPEEVCAIQKVIDQAIALQKEGLAMRAAAATLRANHDPKAADAERAADAKLRESKGLKQQAIAMAVSAYDIDVSHVKSLFYNGERTDAGTDDDNNVEIGTSFFTDPGNLGSTIAHEAEVHVNQQNIKGRGYQGHTGRSLNEVQAYDYEIGNARRFGLTEKQVSDLRKLRADDLARLTKEQLEHRAHGDYTMKKDDYEGY